MKTFNIVFLSLFLSIPGLLKSEEVGPEGFYLASVEIENFKEKSPREYSFDISIALLQEISKDKVKPGFKLKFKNIFEFETKNILFEQITEILNLSIPPMNCLSCIQVPSATAYSQQKNYVQKSKQNQKRQFQVL